MTQMLLVALGGGAGALLRHLSGLAATRLLGPGFPWGTLFVNIAGSLAMGLLVVLLSERLGGRALPPLLMTGLLGGFTTFSSFSLDAMSLYERGRLAAAAAYVGGSVVFAIAGLALGLWLGRQLWSA